jgi:hypothetical protein
MRVLRHVVAALSLTTALLLASGCGSDGGGASGGNLVNSGSAETWDDGEPVQGNVSVTWKNLNPANPPASASLVNESSEIGKKLKSGTASSSEIRVISDAQMGGLLDQLKKFGFFDHATDGLGLDSIPDLPGRRGIVIVTQEGHSRGLMLTTNLGPGPVPQTYRDCKYVVLLAHSQAPGAEVRAGIGAPDDSLLSAPKPRFRKP